MLENKGDYELLTSDDEKDFHLLYNRYWKDLYQKAKARLGSSDDVKDVIQDIFVTLWKNRKSITVQDNLKPYLFTALKYSIIKKIERESPHRSFPLSAENIEQITLSSEELVHYKQLERIVNNAVDQLPHRMKEVYCLSRNNHLKTREIADQLNISEQTVKNILSEALRRLRERFKKQHFTILFLL